MKIISSLLCYLWLSTVYSFVPSTRISSNRSPASFRQRRSNNALFVDMKSKLDDKNNGVLSDKSVITTVGADREDSVQAAIVNTILTVGATGAFGTGLWYSMGAKAGEEFFAGYLVEQSLSVDNLFVFLVLFDFFQVPEKNQNRVLKWGIIGAIVMRGFMVGLGLAALESFKVVLLGFAAILVFSSFKILQEFTTGEEEEEEDMSENKIVQFSKSLFDSTDFYDEDKFFTLVDGVKRATPLLICLVAVELSDVVFAVDSIPAVFGVTKVRI